MDVRSGFRFWLGHFNVRSIVANDAVLGAGGIAVLALLAFLLRLPRWLLLLAGGALALWFISVALERMSGALSAGGSVQSADGSETRDPSEEISLGETR